MLIEVRGKPAPKGSKRHVGGGRMVENNQGDLNTWCDHIRNEVRAYRKDNPTEVFPYTGAVVARMVFSFARPRSVSRRARPFMTVKPDVDKLARGVGDALTDAGVFADDALIVDFTRLGKVYCNEDPEALEVPGVRIVVLPMAPLEELMTGRQ
jgi:Holliday junction resolvase RusA-like endonuclease